MTSNSLPYSNPAQASIATVAANIASSAVSVALNALTSTPNVTDPGELAFLNPDA